MDFINDFYYIFIKDIVTFIFTITGLIIAGIGLSTWKKQIKGNKEFETGYNLHYSVLKLRDAIKHVRNPAIWPSESNKAAIYSKEKHPNKSEEEIQNNAHVNVYEMRWEEITNAYTEIESHLLAAEALWGSHILALVKPLKKKITELNISLQQHFQPELRTKDYSVLRDVVYDGSSENEEDNFGKEISKIIQDITNYLKSKIS